ncbi:MAG TPA: glycoside hydrolase family 2 TIM barrel-domain containing protein [Candidatus Dormibacteraeota bacterium]|nr:glycoside hydrolase family 2 TIM barrel-domain containing protein [Candidatus Dormibacteraeota bacterium]
MTRWAAAVSPTNVHPEYPRPQLARADWLNLNGLWDYAICPGTNETVTQYDGKILVPFPIESALSGVSKPLQPASALCYRRTLSVPANWKGRRVRLQFGAVDWACKVVVNGRQIGQHQGGYERFGFDITDALKWTGQEEMVVRVTDPTEGDQPRGKQSLKPEGIFYIANSGIWQTVWLEPVPVICMDDLRITPDIDSKQLKLRVAVNSLAEDLEIEATARADGTEAGHVSGQPNTELSLPILKPKLWSPESPFLYDLKVRLKRGGKELDRITSYFGMRKVSLVQDRQGYTCIGLNGLAKFQIGVLDQGFWPDGIYTAPSEEAMDADLATIKSGGFNMVRKHVKIEPDRWYYLCDKLGLLVWQDMPSGNNATAAGQRQFESELLHMLKDLHNHSSVVIWVLFNEGWGQYDTQRLTQKLKALDPSRLIDSASGWTDMRVGDIVDVHNYPGPAAPQSEPRRAAVLGEFGGLGLVVDGHCWSNRRQWSYRMESNSLALADSYENLLRQISVLHETRGLSAAVFTQTADVETECNGLLSYDRAVVKMERSRLAVANGFTRRAALNRVFAADATLGNPEWRYTCEKPGNEWITPGLEDASWKQGQAGFGTPQTPGAIINTVWDTSDIWLRRQFTISTADLAGAKLEVHHDEDAEVYLNGVLAAKLPGFISNYDVFDIRPEAMASLHAGTNTLAVHCHQTSGGQYIDVGVVGLPAEEGTAGP